MSSAVVAEPCGEQEPAWSRLGARVHEGGTTFSLWAPRANRVELVLVERPSGRTNHDLSRVTDQVWSLDVPGVGAGQLYGYRVHGVWDPQIGQRFNPAKLLLDPYARAITGGVDYSGPITDHASESTFQRDLSDDLPAVPLSVVVSDTPPPTPLTRPTKASEMVIYETHLKGFTQLHPAVPEHLRGTYAGMAYPAVIDYLVELGVNAVEFLPLHHFVSEPFIVGRGLVNYWGYNTLGFFAPHAAYASSGAGTLGGQVGEFKALVSALHAAGIAVILDVVYNHTGEGGDEGSTLSFRGIDQGKYYRLSDGRNDPNFTGCGNAVNTSVPAVLKLVMDSLRYWATDMGVDGFRFDLATTLIRDGEHNVDQNHEFKRLLASDPILAGKVLIAEPWDLGPHGYQVGNWGPGWSEWNDHFRAFARDFWRDATFGVQELATRLCGSSDIFDHSGRPATSSVNFVTAHDGFTMRDLVSYDGKHNEANAEQNRDGTDDNRSWNHGCEGETTDEGVLAARQRTARNLMATLLLSAGMPMILAGDEAGRTQGGNNNAYCQDSPVSWVNWRDRSAWAAQEQLTRTLLKLRREHSLFRPDHWRYHGEVSDAIGHGLGRRPVAWLAESGEEMAVEQWHDTGRRTLGMYLSNCTEAFLVYFHAGWKPVDLTLPGSPWAQRYQVVAHTGLPDELPRTGLEPGSVLSLPARTVLVLSAEVRAGVQLVPVSPLTPEAEHEDPPDPAR